MWFDLRFAVVSKCWQLVILHKARRCQWCVNLCVLCCVCMIYLELPVCFHSVYSCLWLHKIQQTYSRVRDAWRRYLCLCPWNMNIKLFSCSCSVWPQAAVIESVCLCACMSRWVFPRWFLPLVHVIRFVRTATPIDGLLLAVASVYVGMYVSRGAVVGRQSPLIPSAGVGDLQIINTEANQQPAAQGRRGDSADGRMWKWVWLLHVIGLREKRQIEKETVSTCANKIINRAGCEKIMFGFTN